MSLEGRMRWWIVVEALEVADENLVRMVQRGQFEEEERLLLVEKLQEMLRRVGHSTPT